MRERLCLALARHAGETLTQEVAGAVVREFFGPPEHEIAPLTVDERNTLIERLEVAAQGIKPVDCPVREFFIPGFYVREITIPAGVCLTGAKHRVENQAFLTKGSMRLLTDKGPEVIFSPRSLVCMAGRKNVAVTLEECVWVNFFPTDETDPDKVIEAVSYATKAEILGGASNAQALAYEKLSRLES